jgi:hypothetical protein
MRTIIVLAFILFIWCCKSKPAPEAAPQPAEVPAERVNMAVTVSEADGHKDYRGYFGHKFVLDSNTYYHSRLGSYSGMGYRSPYQLSYDLEDDELYAYTKDPVRIIKVRYTGLPICVLNAKNIYTRWIRGQDFIIINNYGAPAKLVYFGDTVTLGENTSYQLYTNFTYHSLRDTNSLHTDTAFISGYFIRNNVDDTLFLQDLARVYRKTVRFAAKPLGITHCRMNLNNYPHIDSLLPYVSRQLGFHVEHKDDILVVCRK